VLGVVREQPQDHLQAAAAGAQQCLYRFKTRRMACDLGIDEISYAAR
jgi:hypothetical protein